MKARAEEANRDGVTGRVSGRFFLQRRREEMLAECGEEDGEQGEGKASVCGTWNGTCQIKAPPLTTSDLYTFALSLHALPAVIAMRQAKCHASNDPIHPMKTSPVILA